MVDKLTKVANMLSDPEKGQAFGTGRVEVTCLINVSEFAQYCEQNGKKVKFAVISSKEVTFLWLKRACEQVQILYDSGLGPSAEISADVMAAQAKKILDA